MPAAATLHDTTVLDLGIREGERDVGGTREGDGAVEEPLLWLFFVLMILGVGVSVYTNIYIDPYRSHLGKRAAEQG